jgi:ABC-type antimicrobial peptide transport system permease subunit
VYVPFGRYYRATMHVQAKLMPGSSERAAMDAMREEIRRVDARIPVLALSTMRAFHDGSIELWGLRTGARAFAGLGLLALLLAAIGVYGVKSYTVARRTREIGIRMALGASARDVMRLILGDGLLLTGIGLAIGLPLAVLVSIAFQSVFVDIGGIDVAVLVVATLVLASAATLASALPARRAMKVQPLVALQTD